MKPSTLKAGNFEALYSTDPITILKDLDPLKEYIENQEASNNFRLGFVCSKDPHINSSYQVKVRFLLELGVSNCKLKSWNFDYFYLIYQKVLKITVLQL